MKKKIFIIEDDANILYGLQAKFSVSGFDVEINNGSAGEEEVLKDIVQYKPDYIILDLILPVIDGFKLAKVIRENENIKNTPIFVFTSLSDKDSKERGLNIGVDYYLLKTELNIDEFVVKVMKIIQNQEKK